VGPRAATVLTLASIAAVGCSSGSGGPQLSQECLAIAQQYAAAYPAAQICDPADPTSCSASEPVVIYEQQPDGGLMLQGICNCTNAVNPARKGTLDSLLAEFSSKGCAIGNCPCPAPHQGQTPPPCNATDAGIGTCAPPVF
jgi:hypothetical protein